jgi:short-chain Z-isoprenyl diphosphate synthase
MPSLLNSANLLGPLTALAPLAPLYRLYERHLLNQVLSSPTPRHIGLILDGNRRYARASGLRTAVDGHRHGASKLEEVLDWIDELGIEVTTVYALSTENFDRPEEELQGLFTLLDEQLLRIAEHPRTKERGLRVKIVGRLELLPDSLRRRAEDTESRTADHTRSTLNIAVGYGGRQEIVDAVKSYLADCGERGLDLAKAAGELDSDAVARHLYMYGLPDPDLIIRTSGELRLSGFLMWQSAYSELYFCDAFWPAFRKTDLLRAMRSYQSRKRRMGK